MSITKTAKEIANKSSDAYSYDRYASWHGCALALLKRGYNDREVEAILRSKWMRWAGDNSDKTYGKYTSSDILNFIDNPRNNCTKAAVDDLVRQTF